MQILSFEKILFFSAILLAFCGGYFSIVGIATLFSGAIVATTIMASAIEIGKLCTVTFLYRYWKVINKALKTYLLIASLVLMIITSLGIFAYLSSAYQKSSSDFKGKQDKIEMVSSRNNFLKEEIEQSKSKIENINLIRKEQESRLDSSITNAFITRNPIELEQLQSQTSDMINSENNDIKTEEMKIQSLANDIETNQQQINTLKFGDGSKDIKIFQFIADQFNTTLDNVAKWMIIVIIFVFDPLSIALILSYNVATYKKNIDIISTSVLENIKKEESLTKSIPILENKVVPVSTPIVPSPTPTPIVPASPSALKALGAEHAGMFIL
jgi:hypothetical protein